MSDLVLGIPELTKVLDNLKKNDQIERQVGGGDIIEQKTYANKQLLEIENNTFSLSKLTSNSGNKNIQVKKKNKFSNNNNNNNNNNNTTFTDDKIQEYNIQSIKSISEKQQNADMEISSTALLSNQRIELDQDVLDQIDCHKQRNEIIIITTTLTQMKEEICNLREQIYEIIKAQGQTDKKYHSKKYNISTKDISQEKYFLITQKHSNLKLSEFTDLICNVEKSLMNTIQCIEKRFENFEEYVQCSLRNINDFITKNKNEEELFKYVHAVRKNFEIMRKDVLDLQYSQNVKNKQTEVFEEKLELLKLLKADKNEVEEALIDKADTCALNKKVSYDQFDAVCDDLARSLNDVITKLSQQESIWQQSFHELRNEIEGKFDELKIHDLKDFINNELQALKNQLQLISEVKHEQEAAGAKKILRNLHCISCDKDAFMQTNLKIINSSQPFSCRSNIKPFLTFKMDQIRNKKKMIFQKEKVTHLEKFTSENLENNRCGYTETYQNMSRNDFCNRYCGGSHTIMSPQQRVTTLQKAAKNCVTLSDVNNLHLIEGVVKGTDGRIYRGRQLLE